MLLVLEVCFIVLGLVGVAMVHVPAALILAGALGVLVTERAMSLQQEGERGGEGAG